MSRHRLRIGRSGSGGRRAVARLAAAAGLALAAGLVRVPPTPAEVAPEPIGRVLELPAPSPHWVLVGDFLLRRAALLDADDGRFLGQVNGGLGSLAPLLAAARGELLLPATYYTRGTRGARADVVEIYDARRLAPIAEVEIPPKRADVVHGAALATLLDDERFLVLYNFTPAQSVSVVDVPARRFAGEIATPGCGLVYAAGTRRFAMLCGDGSLLVVTLDETGAEASRERTERFFDPLADPVTEKAVRAGDTWLFVSFAGVVHPVDVAGPALRFGETWSLLDEGDRDAAVRVGGAQYLAAHAASGRLYALVHEGPAEGSHKGAGRAVRVYDVAGRRRVAELAVPNLLAAFVGERMGATNGTVRWLLDRIVPDPGVDSIAVTQDADPRLLLVSREAGTVAVLDARSGAHLRNLEQVGLAPGVLSAPWPGDRP